MRVVYRAENLFDAHLVKHALEAAGMPAFVFGESLLGGLGELPLFGVLRVCVPEAAWPQAHAIVLSMDLGTGQVDPLPSEDEGGIGVQPA